MATHEYLIKLTGIQQFIQRHVVNGTDTGALKYQKGQIHNKYDMLYVRWFWAGISMQSFFFLIAVRPCGICFEQIETVIVYLQEGIRPYSSVSNNKPATHIQIQLMNQ